MVVEIPTPEEIWIFNKKAVPLLGPFGIMKYCMEIGLLIVLIEVNGNPLADVAVSWSILLRGVPGYHSIEGGVVRFSKGENWNPVGEACKTAAESVRRLCQEMGAVADTTGPVWWTKPRGA